jgi:hypothetical protein
MVYIISGLIIALCIVIMIFGLKVLKENRQMKAELKEKEKDDERVRF